MMKFFKNIALKNFYMNIRLRLKRPGISLSTVVIMIKYAYNTITVPFSI